MTPSTPQKAADQDGSVIIVGAGIVGIACAHYLSESGLRVTVIDRGTIAGACSHANCGYICPSHVLPLTEPGVIGVALRSLLNPRAPFRVKPRISPALWNWMFQFARRCNRRQMLTAGKALRAILDTSIAEYRRLIPEQSLNCEWKENGLLYVLQTEQGMKHFAETDRLLTDHFGVSAQRIDGTSLPSFDPALKAGLAGAFHYPGDASVRPDRLNAEWAARLRERGVQFIEHCELLGISKSGGRITELRTSQGDLTAGEIVFAMGAWSARWSEELECRVPIQPGKGYSITMPRPEPCPRYPILFPEHKVGVSPFENGYRLGSMMEFSGYDSTIPAHRIQQLRDSAKPYLVAPVDGPAEETWYGWRPMTWDSLPIIGRVPKLTNAFLAAGHNMLGLTLAPATGRIIAEMITGQPALLDVTPYSPARF
ncbi:FAD-dependent oxidoreductase [bacterium]|nr:FAD-dependent oxidoreductase [bacterium]